MISSHYIIAIDAKQIFLRNQLKPECPKSMLSFLHYATEYTLLFQCGCSLAKKGNNAYKSTNYCFKYLRKSQGKHF